VDKWFLYLILGVAVHFMQPNGIPQMAATPVKMALTINNGNVKGPSDHFYV
jgi:hypothetical protein